MEQYCFLFVYLEISNEVLERGDGTTLSKNFGRVLRGIFYGPGLHGNSAGKVFFKLCCCVHNRFLNRWFLRVLMELPKRYDSKEREAHWQKYWEEENIYAFDENSDKPIFSIDTPPPTVSGKMHMGHACSYSQMDFVARYKRMRGYNLFYPFGTDDNGLATERLIEKMNKVKSADMERGEFIKLCLETLERIRPDFVNDWKKLAVSCDYNIFYSTINEHCRRISQWSFIDLYKKGREYRKKAPVIFCPVCKTAIAQVEMEDSERTTTLNYIKAKVETGEYVIYATTRPELHPACVGISIDKDGMYVAVDVKGSKEKWIISKDAVEKFSTEFPMNIVKEFKGKDLIGKKVEIPLAEKPVAFSHDESANTAYGSGVVYYCTYGGFDCVEWMARHPDVKPIHIMDESGTYTFGPYKGLRSADARKKALEDLEKMGALLKKEPLQHTVNVHERCGTDIEYIATTQWFIKVLDMKDDLITYGKQMNWHPGFMFNRYENWAKGLQWDWCISRQRYFGVPFPVWYCKRCGEVKLAEEKQLPVDPLSDKPKGKCDCGSSEFEPEKDVLDTWATSSLTPILAADLYKGKKIRDKLFPMSLRPQAHDIITFWLFNTVVKSHLHFKKNPWQDIVISGFVLDPKGRKMSKSLGNVIEPQMMIEKYSADALRFWAPSTKLGEDLPFMEKELVAGQKFVTKLWNAGKFVIMHLEDFDGKEVELETFDKWLLSKLNKMINVSTENFEKYEYSRTKLEVERFFWHVFCDNYLEIVKERLYNPAERGEGRRKAAQYSLYTTLLNVLRLMAPITSHITEEVYQAYFRKKEGKKSVHHEGWPVYDKSKVDEKAEQAGDWGVDIIAAVRKFKSEKGLSLKEEIKMLTLKSEIEGFEESIRLIEGDLKSVTKTKEIRFGNEVSRTCDNFPIEVGINLK